MNKLLLFFILIVFSSCNLEDFKKKIKDETKQLAAMREVWNENECRSDYFDLSFTVDTNWIKKEKQHSSGFKGSYFEADHAKINSIGEPIADVIVSYQRKVSIDKNPSVEKELNKKRDRFKSIYLPKQLEFSTFEKKSISKHNFVFDRIKVSAFDEVYYADEYMLKKDDYFLSILFTYKTEEGLAVCKQFLETIK